MTISEFATGLSLPGGKEELKIDGSGIASKYEGISVSPKTAFVIKTRHVQKDSVSKKLFVNVVSHEAVTEPCTDKRLGPEGIEVEGLNIPVSVGPYRDCNDKSGQAALVIDCIVNPDVLDSFSPDFLCDFVLQCIEAKGTAKIDRIYTLPKISYKSSQGVQVATQMIRDDSKRPKIQEIEALDKEKRNSRYQREHSLTEDEKAKRPTPRSYQHIPIDVRLELTDGRVLDLVDFVKEYNKSATMSGEPQIDLHTRAPIESENNCFPSQLLDFPLVIDLSRAVPKPFKVHATATVECAEPENIHVDLSAYSVTIFTREYGETTCILPLNVQTSSAETTYCGKSSLVCIKARCIFADGNNPDPGTPQWTLLKGVSGQSRTKHDDKPKGCDKLEETSSDEDADEVQLLEDQFHCFDPISQHYQQRAEEEHKVDNVRIGPGHSGSNANATKSDVLGLF